MDIASIEPCKPNFVKLEILTLPRIFIFQSLVYVKENIGNVTLRRADQSHNNRFQNKIDIRHVRLIKILKAYFCTSVNKF